MIEVSVAGGNLVAQRKTPLSIRFANTGELPCSNIVFRLKLPAGVVLIGGSDRVEIPVIAARGSHTHEVTVNARLPGAYELTSSNFSYRDGLDNPVRVKDFRAALKVTAAPRPEALGRPLGRLAIECESGELDLDAWDRLSIMVTNDTGVAIGDVRMAVEGPFSSDGRRSGVAALGDGAKARFSFHVRAAEGGRHVPVTIRTTFSHRDASGAARTITQQDSATVVVRPAEHRSPAAPEVQTILYLTANPQDRPDLRSDLEMRKVKERLRLADNRDRFRIEWCPAARLEDISQALMDYKPRIVHFSGHGDEDGNLCVEDEIGNSDLITPEGLADLFGLHRSTIRCVVVTACYSQRLAEALAERIDHVVGMRYRIEDEAAIQFSVGFYMGLFGDGPVPDAFTRGLAHIKSKAALGKEHLSPLLFPRTS